MKRFIRTVCLIMICTLFTPACFAALALCDTPAAASVIAPKEELDPDEGLSAVESEQFEESEAISEESSAQTDKSGPEGFSGPEQTDTGNAQPGSSAPVYIETVPNPANTITLIACAVALAAAVAVCAVIIIKKR